MAELKERNSKEMGDDFFQNHMVIIRDPIDDENLEHNVTANFINLNGKLMFLPKEFNPKTGLLDDTYSNRAVLNTVNSVSKFVSDEMEMIRKVRYSKSNHMSASHMSSIDPSLLRSVETKWRAACNHIRKTYGLTETSAEVLVNMYFHTIRKIVENQTHNSLSLNDKFELISFRDKKVNAC